MNTEEFAFFNQQLAAMLRENLPLEGSLRHLCSTLERGVLRKEIELLEADLAAGVALPEAITRRQLPELYIRLVSAGARGQQLPQVLTLLADYYRHTHGVWTRLQGLMVYPAIILVCSLLFSVWLGVLFHRLGDSLAHGNQSLWNAAQWNSAAGRENFEDLSYAMHLWLPTGILAVATFAGLAVAFIGPLRRELNWRLPGFKQVSLARVGAALAILLKGGATLQEALLLVGEMERGTSAGRELARWSRRCEEGHGKIKEITAGSRVFPPMFLWLVVGAGEDLATGFQRAAESYRSLASRRSEVLLHAALPAALLFLGLLILSQMYPMAVVIFRMSNVFK